MGNKSVLFDRKSNRILEEESWPLEGALDEFLLFHPQVLSRLLTVDQDDTRIFPLAGAQFGGQLQQIDALFVFWGPGEDESEPSLVIVEDKRASSGDLKNRAALGQVLEYAARLTTMDDIEFHGQIVENVHSHLAEVFEKAGVRREKNDEEVIRGALDAKRHRRFYLLLCAERIPPELVTTVAWLNGLLGEGSPGPGFVKLLGSEMRPHEESLVQAALIADYVGITSEAVVTDLVMQARVRGLLNLLRGEVETGWLRAAALDVVERTGGRSELALLGLGQAANAPSGPAPKPLTLAEWKEKKGGEWTNRLADQISAGIARPTLKDRYGWRPGTGNLCLDLTLGEGRRVGSIVRLKRTTVSVAAKERFRSQPAIMRWLEQELRRLPWLSDPDTPQPTIVEDGLRSLVSQGAEPLLQFLSEVARRAEAGE